MGEPAFGGEPELDQPNLPAVRGGVSGDPPDPSAQTHRRGSTSGRVGGGRSCCRGHDLFGQERKFLASVFEKVCLRLWWWVVSNAHLPDVLAFVG